MDCIVDRVALFLRHPKHEMCFSNDDILTGSFIDKYKYMDSDKRCISTATSFVVAVCAYGGVFSGERARCAEILHSVSNLDPRVQLVLSENVNMSRWFDVGKTIKAIGDFIEQALSCNLTIQSSDEWLGADYI